MHGWHHNHTEGVATAQKAPQLHRRHHKHTEGTATTRMTRQPHGKHCNHTKTSWKVLELLGRHHNCTEGVVTARKQMQSLGSMHYLLSKMENIELSLLHCIPCLCYPYCLQTSYVIHIVYRQSTTKTIWQYFAFRYVTILQFGSISYLILSGLYSCDFGSVHVSYHGTHGSTQAATATKKVLSWTSSNLYVKV